MLAAVVSRLGLAHFVILQHRLPGQADVYPGHLELGEADQPAQLLDGLGRERLALRLHGQQVNPSLVEGEVGRLLGLFSARKEGFNPR